MITVNKRKNGEIWYAVAGILSFRTLAEAQCVVDDYVRSL